MKNLMLALGILVASINLTAQKFYFGDDLSYVNEMEDCGVIFKENGAAKDPFQIFADNNHNIVRVRLWHTPSFYDTLNTGKRYSDFADVRKTIMRAKAAGMEVLLDFHLSDFWADPSRQLVPVAWEPVVNNLPILKDSLYNYVQKTLISLDSEGLLPELVQIGNETNKGIMQSPASNNAGWALDWNRNAQLFKRGIEAVRNVETSSGKKIKVAIHIAGPADAGWLMKGFWDNGVKDFDIIGMSYYWAWHKPTTIFDCGNIIATLKQTYPGKEVMIFETGYIWTMASNDNASNIISTVHPNYSPASPANQKKWLVDLTKKVIEKGGSGVFYWEPAWVSSTCWTPWGQGSHQEHAAFFDFQTNSMPDAGMSWPGEDYGLVNSTTDFYDKIDVEVSVDRYHNSLLIKCGAWANTSGKTVTVSDTAGRVIFTDKIQGFNSGFCKINLPVGMISGVYFVSFYDESKLFATEKIAF